MVWKDKHGRPEPFVHPDIKSGKADGKAQISVVDQAEGFSTRTAVSEESNTAARE